MDYPLIQIVAIPKNLWQDFMDQISELFPLDSFFLFKYSHSIVIDFIAYVPK